MNNIFEELNHLDLDQLVELNEIVVGKIRGRRAVKARAVAATLSEGDTVGWHGKKGHQQGEVLAIKRKYAHVQSGGYLWRVPMNMLKKM